MIRLFRCSTISNLKSLHFFHFYLGNNQLEIDGYVNGEIKNDNDNLSLTLNTEMKYLKFWVKENVFFLSNLDVGFNVENKFSAKTLDDISAELKLKQIEYLWAVIFMI